MMKCSKCDQTLRSLYDTAMRPRSKRELTTPNWAGGTTVMRESHLREGDVGRTCVSTRSRVAATAAIDRYQHENSLGNRILLATYTLFGTSYKISRTRISPVVSRLVRDEAEVAFAPRNRTGQPSGTSQNCTIAKVTRTRTETHDFC